MVNKKNMRLVVAALRSGAFEQGQGLLKQKTASGSMLHCCLGVACEVAMRNGIELEVTVSGMIRSDQIGYRFDGGGSALPYRVMEWLGLETPNPLVDLGMTAIMANDAYSWDFKGIADGFESYYGLLEEGGGDAPGTD